jgi:hypothetical protein
MPPLWPLPAQIDIVEKVESKYPLFVLQREARLGSALAYAEEEIAQAQSVASDVIRANTSRFPVAYDDSTWFGE